MLNSLQPHELQLLEPPVHHNLPEFAQVHVIPWWCPTISILCALLLLLIFPSIRQILFQ